MKKRKFLLVFIIFHVVVNVFSQGSGVKWFEASDGRGFVNLKGEMLKIENDRATVFGGFHNGLALVYYSGKMLFGYINTEGKTVIPPQFEEAKDFSDGYAVVSVDRNGPNGLIDTNGNWVIKPVENVYMKGFSEGICFIFDTAGNYYAIDRNLKKLFDLKYEYAPEQYSDGMVVIMDGTNWPLVPSGYFDMTGKAAIPIQYHDAESFSEGIAVVNRNNFINKQGKKLFPDLKIDEAVKFSDGMCKVLKNGRIGFINTEGKIVIEPQFTGATDFHNGIAAVTFAEKRMADILGDEITSLKGTALVSEAEWGFIDKEGNWIVEPKYLYPKFAPEGDDVVHVRVDKDGIIYYQMIIISQNCRVIWEVKGYNQ